MKNILAFGASSSKKSINKSFASWAANQLQNIEVEVLDLNDYEMPIYSIDKENESGIPQEALDFKQKVKNTDAIIISFAEHNGSFSSAFKNIFDWISRIEKSTWSEKPMLLLATSPGRRGGQTVLESATSGFPHRGAEVIGSFSLPSFNHNFSIDQGITDKELLVHFKVELNKLQLVLNN